MRDDAIQSPQGGEDGRRARFQMFRSLAARVQTPAQLPADRSAHAVRDTRADVVPDAGAPGCKLIALALAWPVVLGGSHEDEMDNKASEQIQPAFNKSMHALWQARHVRHVSQHIRQPHCGAKRVALLSLL